MIAPESSQNELAASLFISQAEVSHGIKRLKHAKLLNSEGEVISDSCIEFVVHGQFPGDGKPKPVAFPDPGTSAEVINNVRYLKLPALIDIKLASGMTNSGRLRDLADVQELIRVLKLPAEFAQHLNPFVRAKFEELRQAFASSPAPEE